MTEILIHYRNYLSSEEQAQVINESLIYPDAILKYSINEKESHILPDSFSTLKISYGCKILQDETGSQWRDEHSAPFSWKTASQLFISPPTKSTPKKESKPTPRKKPPVPPPKPPKPVMKIENNVEETVVISNKNMGLETTIPFSDSAQSLQNEEVISSNRDSLNSQVISKHENNVRLFLPI